MTEKIAEFYNKYRYALWGLMTIIGLGIGSYYVYAKNPESGIICWLAGSFAANMANHIEVMDELKKLQGGENND